MLMLLLCRQRLYIPLSSLIAVHTVLNNFQTILVRNGEDRVHVTERPAKCPGMIAFIRDVIVRSTFSEPTLNVAASTSTQHRRRTCVHEGLTVAQNVAGMRFRVRVTVARIQYCEFAKIRFWRKAIL
jgi:hypothetical protein